MKAMILAAGKGERMRPLTLSTPKPLLEVGGRPLLEHHILNLRDAGVMDIVVNAAWLAEQIIEFCGDGSRWGVSIEVSREEAPLETAGGIIQALPLLGDSPFLLVNGDIYCPYTFAELLSVNPPVTGAHLVLVDNPEHNPQGDFSLESGQVQQPVTPVLGGQTLTYSGMGVYSPALFAGLDPGKRPLKPLLDQAILRGCLSGSHWQGAWHDIGTPERLADINAALT